MKVWNSLKLFEVYLKNKKKIEISLQDSKKNILKKKLKDPLFYVHCICFNINDWIQLVIKMTNHIKYFI